MQKEFLEELKVQLKDISDTNENIKRRSTQMVSFIGIIIAAATGLGLDSDWSADLETAEGWAMVIWLVIGMMILGIALVVYFTIIKTRSTTVPIVSKKLLRVCCDELRLTENYRKVTGKEPRLYYEFMSKMYLDAMKDNEKINGEMATRFNWATGIFVAGVLAYAAWALVVIGL